MHGRAVLCLSLAMSIVASAGPSQPLSRLKGKVLSDRGDPIAAEVRIEALAGPRGEEYVGQRSYTVLSNAKGEWTLLGFKAGTWMFASAPEGLVPDVVVLPINVFVPAGAGLAGITPTWQPVLKPASPPPGEVGQWLSDGTVARKAGDKAQVARTLSLVPAGADAEALAAAGRICLLVHDAGLARAFFTRALERDRSSFRAQLGIGSTAMMVSDFNAAGKAFKAARALTTDKDERTCLTAAIADLSRMDISGH
jgi:hypothetical protein